MNRLLKIVFTLQLSILMNLYAQQDKIQFEHITIEQGLSHGIMNSVFQDSRGFIWFGTDDGLNRFDGYSFTVFKKDPKDPTSLNENIVWNIIEDRLGTFWIGTLGGGLEKFDPRKEKFTHFGFDPNNPNSLSGNFIRALCEGDSGILWIGTDGGGLNKFDTRTGNFTRYQHNPNDPNSLSQNQIWALCFDRSGRLWVGTNGGGLNQFDPEKGQFIHYRNDPRDPTSLSNNQILSMCESRSGKIWVGTNGGGLNEFDPEKRQFVHYLNDPRNPNSLSENRVWALCEDRSGTLWIGTDGGGLNKFDPAKKQFMYYVNNPSEPSSLSYNTIRVIYEDRMGIIWVGTYGKGLDKFNRNKKQFILYQTELNNPNSLNNNNVAAIYEDRSGKLWIGTDGGGLNELDRRNGKFTFYRSDPRNPNSLSNDNVLCIFESREGELWVGTYTGGLNRFDRKNRRFTSFRNDPNNPNSLSSDFVRSIYQDKKGILWIGTSGGGLNRFDRDKNQFISYQNDSGNPHSISSNIILTVYEDRSGQLWVGTYGAGLNQFDREKGQFIRYQNDFNDPRTLSDNKIYVIFEDPAENENVLWIGTGSGLNKFDVKKETFTCYSTKDGLPNNVVYGILKDEHENFWLSTAGGVSKFNPKTGAVKNYGQVDGLQSNGFNIGAFYKSRSGEMFFGGVNGFDAFYPDSIKDNLYISPVVITDIKIFNQSVPIGKREGGRTVLAKSILETKEIGLSYRDNVFSFEFAALHYAVPEKNQYAYMMEGFEKGWNYTDSSRRFASYTNLGGGKYVFRVKGSNSDGIWNEKGTSIKITIDPPFWETWWFRIFVGVALVAGVVIGYKRKVKSIETRKRELEVQVEDRTHELKEKNILLKQFNMELEQAQNMLTKTNIALQRSNTELEEFAYVASHDLQEPLRMVSSYITLLAKRYKEKLDSDAQDFISFAVDGAKRMQQLINDLLSYSRVTTQGKPFEVIDCEEMFNSVLLDMKITIEEKGAKVTHDPLPKVMADGSQLGRLFQNLIGNGLKYQKDKTPEIHVSAESKNGEWIFSVKDNGIGIASEYYDKIFGIFQRLHTREEYSGTGIGLAVCKKIVERHGGRIWVESEVGKGSEFYFTIPLIEID